MVFSAFSVFSRHLAALLIASVLAGCASMSGSPDAIVRARATELSRARIANDFDAAYLLTAPSFRAVTPLAGYKSTFVGPVQWTAAEVVSVTCETEDKCEARIKVEAKTLFKLGGRQVPPISTYLDESWIRENGQWWLFPTP
jgi:hypothetical protein